MAAATVNWSLMSGSTTLSKSSTTTSTTGLAGYTAAVPAMAAGKSVQLKGCLGDGTCTVVTAMAESPAAPVVIALSGTAQTIPDNANLAMLTLLVTDGAVPGNPLAGASVIFNQTLYAYSPPAAPGKKLPPAKILAQQQVTAVTGASGMVSLQPLQQAGIPATLVVTATVATGAGTGRQAGSYTEVMQPVDFTGTALQRDRYRASR
jgi:hypothetical protein